jgi:large repetitive protein
MNPSCLQCIPPCKTCKTDPSECESCNEGYALDGDGNCLQCTAIQGYDLPYYVINGETICTEICGDGLHLGHYECDDGNIIDGDGCSKDCSIEDNFACSQSSPSVCRDI